LLTFENDSQRINEVGHCAIQIRTNALKYGQHREFNGNRPEIEKTGEPEWRSRVTARLSEVQEGREATGGHAATANAPSASWMRQAASERTQMKKPVFNPSERPARNVWTLALRWVKHPTRPGVRIYQECKECLGKGKVAAK
jgi:hypothetical protein